MFSFFLLTTRPSNDYENHNHNYASGEYTLDYEWYLSTQILPPISRLCEPIEGTSPAILSERLGLDASKYARFVSPSVLPSASLYVFCAFSWPSSLSCRLKCEAVSRSMCTS